MSTQLASTLDYTALSCAARCGRLYQLQYEQRWRKREVNVPMHAGSAMHAALEVLYTKAWDRTEALEALREAWGDFRVPPASKHGYMTLGHLEVALQNYMDDRERKPTALEDAIGAHALRYGEQAVVFDWPHPETGKVLRVGGKLDLPTLVAGQHAIVDHKTSTQWVNEYWYKQRFALGHQLRIYAAAMQALTGEAFESGYINGIYIGEKAADPPEAWRNRKSVPNALFGPEDFTPARMAETWEWVAGWSSTISHWRGLGVWPQNEGACGDYGGCDFLGICKANPVTRESQLLRDYVRWEPQGVLASGADGNVNIGEAA